MIFSITFDHEDSLAGIVLHVPPVDAVLVPLVVLLEARARAPYHRPLHHHHPSRVLPHTPPPTPTPPTSPASVAGRASPNRGHPEEDTPAYPGGGHPLTGGGSPRARRLQLPPLRFLLKATPRSCGRETTGLRTGRVPREHSRQRLFSTIPRRRYWVQETTASRQTSGGPGAACRGAKNTCTDTIDILKT